MMANHKEKQWEWKGKKYTACPGQFVTSLPSLEKYCGKNCSVQKIRTALKRFAKYGFLTDESTPHNRLITIVNWGVYQGVDKKATVPLTDTSQTTDRQLTVNNNVKNENKNNTIKEADESSIFNQLALALVNMIKMNHPNTKEPNLQKWSNDFRLMVERDGRTIEQITQLINWSGQHSFWYTVILSPSSIRRNWDRLISQLKQERTTTKGQVLQVPNKPIERFELDFTKGEVM